MIKDFHLYVDYSLLDIGCSSSSFTPFSLKGQIFHPSGITEIAEAIVEIHQVRLVLIRHHHIQIAVAVDIAERNSITVIVSQ